MALPITAMLMLGACNAKEDTVGSASVSFSTQKLSGPINGLPLIEVVGTYDSGTCLNRSGSWSVGAGGFGGPLEHTAISVVKNDADCLLKITKLIFDSDPGPGVVKKMFDIVSPSELALGATFATPVAFQDAVDLADNPDFYATARLVDQNPGTDLNFDSDMTLYIKASSDLSTLSNSITTYFATVTITNVVYNQVPAPTYTYSDVVSIYVDANFVVQNSSSGYISFFAGVTPGLRYAIRTGPINLNSYDAVKTAFAAGGTTTVGGSPVDITVSDLGLIGQTLPHDKYVIFENAEDGVQSFQVFKFTFAQP